MTSCLACLTIRYPPTTSLHLEPPHLRVVPARVEVVVCALERGHEGSHESGGWLAARWVSPDHDAEVRRRT